MKKFKVGQIVEDYDGNPCKVTNPSIGQDKFIEVQRLGTNKRVILFVEDVQKQGTSKATVLTLVVVGFLVLCAAIRLGINLFQS